MANENQIKHKIVISGEQEYKRAMREMSTGLKEAKSEVKATAAEMDAQGRSLETLSAHMKALESQRQREVDMLREMQRHLEAVVSATGAESEEASRLRTRINAMRTEIAQTSSQMARLTGEMDQARESAEELGGSGAADGIRSLGQAAEAAEGDMDGIMGKLASLGQGFTIGIGASLGSAAVDAIKNAIATAIVDGWNEAVQNRIEYNQIGVKTGTAGTGQNLFMSDVLDRLTLTNPNRDASSWIDAIAAAYTQFPESTFQNGERLNTILKNLDAVSYGVGTDLPGAINTIGRLKDVFGENEEELTAIYYWLGTSKAGTDGINTLEKYATTWASIGLNAVGAAGALVLARIAGVDNLDAVGKAAKNAEATLMGDEGTLTKLGLEAADLPKKFRAGGEEAKEAMRLLLNTFLGQDEATQNELGGKIFGQDNWERYGTRIAQAILGGYETELTPGMKEAVDRAAQAMTADLKSQTAITGEIKNQVLGELFAPWEELLLEAVTQGNEKAIEAKDKGEASGIGIGAAWIGGFLGGLNQAAEENREASNEIPFTEYAFSSDDMWASWNAGQESIDAAEEKGKSWFESVFGGFLGGMQEGADEQTGIEVPFAGAEAFTGENVFALWTAGEGILVEAKERGAQFFQDLFGMFVSGVNEANERAKEFNENNPFNAEFAFDAEDIWKSWNAGQDSNMADAAEEAGEAAGEFVTNAYLDGLSAGAAKRNSTAPVGLAAPDPALASELLDQMLGADWASAVAETAEEAGEETGGAALESFGSGLESGADFQTIKAQVENLNAQIGAAINAGDMDLADELKAKRDALLPTMMQLAADAKQTGEDAKDGFDGAFKGVTVTVEDTATGVVTEWKAGTSGLPGAAQNSVDGLMGVLNGAKSPAYTAGFNAGKAFLDGYNDAQGIRSPSRVMAEAARYSMAGLLEGLDSGVPDLMEKANGLSGILSGGAKSAGGTAGSLALSGGGSAISAAELRELLTNIVLTIDGDVAGGLIEKGVSTESARRAAGTIRGRANGVRSW